jgi:Tautomerase enzyme
LETSFSLGPDFSLTASPCWPTAISTPIVVYKAMVEILNAPENDRFQVINEHDADNFVYDPTFFGSSADVVFVQLTLAEGRTLLEQKRGFYKQVVDDLNQRLNLRREDVFISLVGQAATTGRSATETRRWSSHDHPHRRPSSADARRRSSSASRRCVCVDKVLDEQDGDVLRQGTSRAVRFVNGNVSANAAPHADQYQSIDDTIVQ